MASILILWHKDVEKVLLLNKEVHTMKKNITVTIILALIIGSSAHASHHGGAHKYDKKPKIIINDNEYLTNINLMKGHLWVGFELYKASNLDNAKKHMKHPKSELYGGMVPTFEAKGAPGFASELKSLASSVENEEPLKTIHNHYQILFKAINNNEKFISESSDSINKKIELVISLLQIAADEYAVGIVNGKVENKYEYQDALGFTTMAKNILEDITTEKVTEKERLSKIIGILDTLASLWPELVPGLNVNADAKTILDAIVEIKKYSSI